MTDTPKPSIPAYMRRYLIRVVSFMTAYTAILNGGISLARSGVDVGVRVVLALLTASMICGVFWAIFRLLADCDDEYQRLLLVKTILLATAATLAISTFWEFLHVYHVLVEGPRWIEVIWLAMFGLAAPIVRWRS